MEAGLSLGLKAAVEAVGKFSLLVYSPKVFPSSLGTGTGRAKLPNYNSHCPMLSLAATQPSWSESESLLIPGALRTVAATGGDAKGRASEQGGEGGKFLPALRT